MNASERHPSQAGSGLSDNALWALRSGQFDDMDGAALRILIDDEEASECGEDESVKTTRSDQPPSVG